MDNNELIERITRTEERSKSNTHRLDKIEPVIEEIHTLSMTMAQLVDEIKHTNENVADIKDKVDAIEQEPADKWKDATKSIRDAIFGAIGTLIFAGIVWVLQNM